MSLRALFVSLAVLPLLGAGCVSVSSAPQKAAGGGIFKSTDKAATWTQKVALPTAKGTQSIGGANILALALDPTDASAIYAGTAENGLLYSYDAAESWQRAGGVAAGRVASVAVNPTDKCVIYAALGNRVIKSSDCNRTYDIVYTDPRPEALVAKVLIDWHNPNQVYAGLATGDLIRTVNAGQSWGPLNRWDDAIVSVVMSAGDSRRLWVATKNQGLYLTEDAGATWQDLRKSMDSFDGSRGFYALAEAPSAPGMIFHASRFGLLKSVDSGHVWNQVNILTPPQTVEIAALAVSPKDPKQIYYATKTKLYKSQDGGASWTTADLPTTRQASALALDPGNDAVIYLGVIAPKQ